MAQTLADVILDTEKELTTRDIPDPTDPPEDIWQCSEWQEQRATYETYRYWYDGDKWAETITEIRDDEGDFPLRWPLQINPISKACRIHRAVMLGVYPNNLEKPPVTTLVLRTGEESDEEKQASDKLQRFINQTWYDNRGLSIQAEACLLEQIYGGHVFKIAWEPWNTFLPHGIAIYSLKTPSFFYPVSWNPFNPWDLLDCYIGYKIHPQTAKAQFGVTVADTETDVLYLEHWTKREYKVTVGGKVPVFQVDDREHEAQGENPFGVVPVCYIPHERDGAFLGRSLIGDDSSLIGLAKEINGRLTSKGEIVQETRPVVFGKNLRQGGGISGRVIEVDGQVIATIIDIGDSKPVPGVPEPDLNLLEPQGFPDSIARYDQELLQLWRYQADVASVATGDDDVSGGRITGPVTAYRMWPTMQHTFAERSFFSDGLGVIAQIIHRIAVAKIKDAQNGYTYWKIPAPDIDPDFGKARFGSTWLPMIPIEDKQQSEMLAEELREGGISLYRFLEQKGVQDVAAEEERIWADRERQAEVDAIVERARGEARAAQYNNGSSTEGGNETP